MLTTLEIKDFQSIADITVDFGQYTVIVGRSNSGKSAILRALHTLARNSFVPTYVRSGKTNTQISATFDDVTVTTTRGKESTYTYQLPTKEVEVYTKCARTVPEAISTQLQLPLVADEDVFFTNQFELPFLVGGKASRASAVVGTLTNAVLVNSLAQETNRLRLSTLSRASVRKDDLTALQAERESFGDLPYLEEVLEVVRALVARVEALQAVSRQLRTAITQAEDITQVPVPYVPDLTHHYRQLSLAQEQAVEMARTLRQVDSIQVSAVPSLPDVKTAQWVSFEDATNDFLCLAGYVTKITEAKKEYTQTHQEVNRWETKTAQLNTELAQFSECPLCGQLLPT